MDKTDAQLEFIRRVSDEFRTTLDAASAIARLKMLIDDVQILNRCFEKAPPDSPYTKWRAFGIEIVSYYPVGFITCLEWHARARLVDLLTFKPAAITEDDLKKDIGAKTLNRLIAENASIPHFVAATRNISSADAYLSTFCRVFDALNIKPDPKALVYAVPATKRSMGKSGLDSLAWLFEYRNTLVHEIDQTHVGHPFFHDHLDCDDALALGQFAAAIINTLETTISTSAPQGFPRQLTASRELVDIDSAIETEIHLLEIDLSNRISGFGAALPISHNAAKAEEEMIFHASELHNRWLDLKAPPRRALRRGRLSYLKSLLAALD